MTPASVSLHSWSHLCFFGGVDICIRDVCTSASGKRWTLTSTQCSHSWSDRMWRSSTAPANCFQVNSGAACELVPNCGSCVSSAGITGAVNPHSWAGSNAVLLQWRARQSFSLPLLTEKKTNTHVLSPRFWSSRPGGCLPPFCQRLSAPTHFLSPPPAPPAAGGREKVVHDILRKLLHWWQHSLIFTHI